MVLSDLKWWHWTLATLAIAAAVRVATGGLLPFVGEIAAKPAPAPAADRPHHERNQGPSLVGAVASPGLVVERALPELNRLTIEASISNPGRPAALMDQSAVLVREIARALQAGVSEDSDAVSLVRVLVATRGVDRTGKAQTHLPLYALDFNARDLFALKLDQAKPAAVLSLVTDIVFNGADAHADAKAWCAAVGNRAQARRFCTMVSTARGV